MICSLDTRARKSFFEADTITSPMPCAPALPKPELCVAFPVTKLVLARLPTWILKPRLSDLSGLRFLPLAAHARAQRGNLVSIFLLACQ